MPVSTAGGFYALCAGLALVQFLWHYPSPATPLFTTDLGPVAVLLKQARGAGMVLAGAHFCSFTNVLLQQCMLPQGSQRLACAQTITTDFLLTAV